jgi:hypothetical protein
VRHVVLDLRGLTFMDLGGLRELLRQNEFARSNRHNLAVVRGTSAIERLLKLTGVESKPVLVDDPDDLARWCTSTVVATEPRGVLMAGATITFRVEESERVELAVRAAREKVNLSDYIRVRLGLRALGSEGDDDVQIEPGHEQSLRMQLADHEVRLLALEADRRAGP